MTQLNTITKLFKGKQKMSLQQISDLIPQIPKPSIRRVMGQGEKTGVFERVEKGVYKLKK